MIRLGVNIDHVATVRQARRGTRPDPVEAAALAERGGADSIVCHLREDRRHIQDRDVRALRRSVTTRLNLEMGLSPEIVAIALAVRPDQVTLVPEKRQELTTEGGLDAAGGLDRIRRAVRRFRERGIEVSLFVDPEPRQISASLESGARIVEIHTGRYANRPGRRELGAIARAARLAAKLGLAVAAGHGLDYDNAAAVAAIREIEELNIGHAIVSRALAIGLEAAVSRMKRSLANAR